MCLKGCVFSHVLKMSDKECLVEAANIFNQLHGHAKIDASVKPFYPEITKRIADAYHQMKHNPASSRVKISYHFLEQDIKEQSDFVTQEIAIVCEPCQMFCLETISALTSETRGQNCWVNFGPHLRNARGF